MATTFDYIVKRGSVSTTEGRAVGRSPRAAGAGSIFANRRGQKQQGRPAWTADLRRANVSDASSLMAARAPEWTPPNDDPTVSPTHSAPTPLLTKLSSLFISLVLALPVVLVPIGSVAHADPYRPEFGTRSYYIGTRSTGTLNTLGCDSGEADRYGTMSLFFGSPVKVGDYYGATLFGADDGSIPVIEDLVKAFVRGYDRCASGGIFMRVAAATSNCLIGGAASDICKTSADYKTSAWANNHGAAWARMVNRLDQWSTNNDHHDRVELYAAWDMEPDWSSFGRADNWLHGYDADNHHSVFLNASADGCPPAGSVCNNDWSRSRIWHESWDHAPSYPLPQIYNTTMAKQWESISEYSYHQEGQIMNFQGAMSHDGFNSNEQAHEWLHKELNGSHNDQQKLLHTTHTTRDLTDPKAP